MNINRNNYEAFLIDYLDGNLSAEDRTAVEAFLLVHPDIQAEFEDLATCFLPMDKVPFEGKDDLKIQEDLPRATWLMLQALDGTIAPKEQLELDGIMADQEAVQEFRLLQSTFLNPTQERFDAKNALHFSDCLPPDLEHDLASNDALPILHAYQVTFEDKSFLRIEETLDMAAPMMLATAYAEGDLTAAQEQVAKGKINADTTFKKEVEQLRRMRLVAPEIVFEDKSALKRSETVVLFFTPAIKRAMAIAAVFVLGISIWRPWEQEMPVHGLPTAQTEGPKSIDISLPKLAQDPMKPIEQSDSARPQNNQRVQAIPLQYKEEIAAQSDKKKDELIPHENTMEGPVPEAPIFQLPLEENHVAEQTPILPPAEQTPLYASVPKIKTETKSTLDEPVSVLGFIGHKLEDRIEQSPVYAFFDKKKKEIFDTNDKQEPVRYERIKTAEGVRHKLVLWGFEFQRNKHKD